MWKERLAAVDAGDFVLAQQLTTQIAARPSDCAEDVAVKARLLAELEDAERMPATMVCALLIMGLKRETAMVARGALRVTAKATA